MNKDKAGTKVISESLAKAQKKYQQKITTRSVQFNTEDPADVELLQFLESQNLIFSRWVKFKLREQMLAARAK